MIYNVIFDKLLLCILSEFDIGSLYDMFHSVKCVTFGTNVYQECKKKKKNCMNVLHLLFIETSFVQEIQMSDYISLYWDHRKIVKPCISK